MLSFIEYHAIRLKIALIMYVSLNTMLSTEDTTDPVCFHRIPYYPLKIPLILYMFLPCYLLKIALIMHAFITEYHAIY